MRRASLLYLFIYDVSKYEDGIAPFRQPEPRE